MRSTQPSFVLPSTQRRSSSSSGGNRSSSRSASTATRQPVQSGPPLLPSAKRSSAPVVHQPPTSSGPGLFGQMASTAAGVAVGHTMGQGLSSMLFGGGSSSKEEVAVAPPTQQTFMNESQSTTGQCETSAKDFTRCLESTNNDMNSCSYYLEQLKACQNMFQPTR